MRVVTAKETYAIGLRDSVTKASSTTVAQIRYNVNTASTSTRGLSSKTCRHHIHCNRIEDQVSLPSAPGKARRAMHEEAAAMTTANKVYFIVR